MKLFQKTLLAITTGALMTMGAQAAVTYGNGMVAQPYIGAKIGQYDIDGAKDKATSYGIYGGAKFTPNWGVEAEYLTTSEETAWDETYQYGYDKAEYEGQVYGLYATYDYQFPNTNGLYAKGRLGISKNEVDVKGSERLDSPLNSYYEKYSYSESDTGLAGGLGLGYNLTPNAGVELAYEWYPEIQDSDASGITLGANFKF